MGVADDAVNDVADVPTGGDPSTAFTASQVDATLRFSCSCDYVDVVVSGTVNAFDGVPEKWGDRQHE